MNFPGCSRTNCRTSRCFSSMKPSSPSSWNLLIASGSLPGCSLRVHNPVKRSLLAMCISSGRLSRMNTYLPKTARLRASQGLSTTAAVSRQRSTPASWRERFGSQYSNHIKQNGSMTRRAVLVSVMTPHTSPKTIHARGRGGSCCMRRVSSKTTLSRNALRLVSHTTRTGQ